MVETLNRSLVSLDGQLAAASDVGISVYDHALLYGDGVFDTLVATGGTMFRFQDHCDRLRRSMAAVAIAPFFSDRDLWRWTSEALAAQPHDPAYIKWIVTRGANGTALMDPAGCQPRMIILVDRYVQRHGGSDTGGIALKCVATRRIPAQCLDPKIKSLNYLNLIQAKLEGKAAGADEALLLDIQGNVCEAPGYNIFFVRGGRVHTPGRDILEGITRQTVIEIARARSCEVHIGDYGLYDLYTADEVFLTSTAAGLVPVRSVDGRTIGDGRCGPLFRTFAKDYGDRLADPKTGVAPETSINSGEK